MNFTEQQQAIVDNVVKICSQFGDEYWTHCETDQHFPQEFVSAMVEGGYRVNGRKMWTSNARQAEKILLLTRTERKDSVDKPTRGMTLFFTDLDRDHFELQRIPAMGHAAVESNATFIDDLFIPEEDRIGEEGKGFYYLPARKPQP